MMQKKIAIRCLGEDYNRSIKYVNIDVNSLLLIDRDPDKGIHPDEVKDTDYSFVTIGSQKSKAEVMEEFRKGGFLIGR